ncbi:MAG: hypothetical protein RLY31_2715 [Bacteroidota bacterium]
MPDLPDKDATSHRFRITDNSSLSLEGKTNVNVFRCRCTEKFFRQEYSALSAATPSESLHFRNTGLALPVASLDCGNKLMNKDLQKALRHDLHPFIHIYLREVKPDKCHRLSAGNDWIRLKALTCISINGMDKEYWLDVNALRLSSTRYRFVCAKRIDMTDFGITPPSAMMGMVRVENDIVIRMDLEIALDESL